VSTEFSWPVRVYWEDTDAGGIVYYANYLRFMERARTEWLRAIGIEQEVLLREQQLMFVVVEATARYRLPARYGDELKVTSRIAQWTRASLTFEQNIVRAAVSEPDPQMLVTGRVRVACLDAAKFRPRPLPESLVKEMSR
jgi:acyl-CoA thioester hydrolase